MFRFTPTLALAALLALANVELVHAQTTYTWTQNSVATQTWGTTGNWDVNGVFVTGSANTLRFFADTTTALVSGINNITGSLPSASTMNVLTLNGFANATTTTINIGTSSSTWTLDGTSPTVNLNGLVTGGTSTKDLFYNIAANLTLNQNTTFTGVGTAGQNTTLRNGFVFSGTIGGSGTITKSGTSYLTLSGNNSSYGSAITVSGGVLLLNHNNAAGSGNTITLSGGGLATYSSSINIANAISVSANSTCGNSGFAAWGGTFSGPINVGTSSGSTAVTLTLVQNANANPFTLTGDISKTAGGSGTATIKPQPGNGGPSIIYIQGNVNNANGSVGLTVGTSKNSANGFVQIGYTGKTQNWGTIDMSTADAGSLNLAGNVSATSLLSGTTVPSGGIYGSSGTVNTLTDSQTATTTFYSNIGGPLANQNNVALNLSGSGILTLAGANSFTGGLTVGGLANGLVWRACGGPVSLALSA